jgi:hypothetical protein
MDDGWIDAARRRLVALADDGTWGYRRGAAPAVEPTALAALGLLATDQPGDDSSRALALRASDRLERLQARGGRLGVTATLPEPGWATPLAMLLWGALASAGKARNRAAGWLLGERVDAPPRATDPEGITGHDTSIQGWPWVEGTHSWVEPTALALMALAREGITDHPRVVDGLRLLDDRALEGGGWNYGNTAVFGRPLRPQPAPTGLALLALAARRAGSDYRPRGGFEYLAATLSAVRAAGSLGWGLLGLRAWGRAPSACRDWLAASAADALARDDAAPRLGILLLAAGESSLSLLLPRAEVCDP